jgi:SpoVK/Ycf46/Vps4 family AAA+-type ATPase
LLDHLDALAPVRAGRTGERTDERVVAALLASVDDVLAEGGVFVVGLTSRPELIDPALLRSGRLGLHLEVPLPDAARRRALLTRIAAAENVDITDELVDELVDGMTGWSAADVVMLVKEGVQRAALDDREPTLNDLLDALPNMTRA